METSLALTTKARPPDINLGGLHIGFSKRGSIKAVWVARMGHEVRPWSHEGLSPIDSNAFIVCWKPRRRMTRLRFTVSTFKLISVITLPSHEGGNSSLPCALGKRRIFG